MIKTISHRGPLDPGSAAAPAGFRDLLTSFDFWAKGLILGFVLTFGSFHLWGKVSGWLNPEVLARFDGDPTFILSLILSLATGFGLMAWRVYLAVTYRPTPPCRDEELPTLSVIVPAYNEGRQVMETLLSVAGSDYPAEKMEIFAVDDGSKDDTWEWMQKAAEKLGGRVTLLRQPVNRGKKEALYLGFRRSRGQVLVTIDSDSIVAKDALRQMASPFVRDKRVGAVAGNVRVLNTDEGLIPRMMNVAFTYSFDYVRAGQSRINTVACTPGALSAYRREAVMPVLEEWLNQTFLGAQAKIGEDRAMTNLILRQGYLSHFQRHALVHTNIPATYKGLCKMLLRWDRSNIRESLVMAGFLFTKFRREPASGARLDLSLHLFEMTVGEIFKLTTFYCLLTNPLTVGYNLIIAGLFLGLLPGTVYFIRHRSSDALWAFPYALFWIFGLSWISCYALLTPRRSAWLTRGLSQPYLSVSPALTQTMVLHPAVEAKTNTP